MNKTCLILNFLQVKYICSQRLREGMPIKHRHAGLRKNRAKWVFLRDIDCINIIDFFFVHRALHTHGICRFVYRSLLLTTTLENLSKHTQLHQSSCPRSFHKTKRRKGGLHYEGALARGLSEYLPRELFIQLQHIPYGLKPPCQICIHSYYILLTTQEIHQSMKSYSVQTELCAVGILI